MAVTEEFRNDVIEVLDSLTNALENQSGQNATPIMPEDEIDETVSMPAVKFSDNPLVNSRATPVGYRQVPVATFFNRIDTLAQHVDDAASGVEELKQETAAARDGANQAAERADQATTAATKVNADLNGMTVTITNRQGVSKSVNIGFEILQEHVYPSIAAMNADAANVRAGQFCMIATTDPTSPDNAQLWSRNSSEATSEKPFTFLSDLDQASSAAFADWLDNYKPVIEADHTRAENDHSTASSDHGTAEADHERAGEDHQTASSDHTRAERDHATAETDHQAALSDHERAGEDHDRALTDTALADTDHRRAESDHTRAGEDHQTALSDHGQAQTDHTRADEESGRALSDHERAGEDHQTAFSDHTRADDIYAHQPYVADGTPQKPGDAGCYYSWDYAAQQYVRGAKLSLDWESMTEEQRDALAQYVLSQIAFDAVPTKDSTNAVHSGGVYSALQAKQDKLTFATDALCATAAAEIVFTPSA